MTSLPDRRTGSAQRPGSPARRAGAVVYDFRRPTTLAREHARVLELAFETFARQWATQLTAKIRVMTQVNLDSVQMQSYDDYVAGLPQLTTMVLCEAGALEARAVIQFPAAEALNWVCHMLGSHQPGPLPDRAFTRIESTLVRQLVGEAVEDLHYSLGSLLQERITVASLAHQPQFAQAAAKSQIMIIARLRVRVAERSAYASVALPAELLLEQLVEASPREELEDAPKVLAASVGTVPVPVQLSTRQVAVTPQQILELAVGDVLPLGHRVHEPLDLLAGGHRVATAAAGTRNGQIAAVIVSTPEG